MGSPQVYVEREQGASSLIHVRTVTARARVPYATGLNLEIAKALPMDWRDLPVGINSVRNLAL